MHALQHAKRMYGKMWGKMRESCNAVTMDFGAVQEDLYMELDAAISSVLRRAKERAEVMSAQAALRPLVGDAVMSSDNTNILSEILSVQDPAAKGGAAGKKTGKLCGYCRQPGHRQQTCKLKKRDAEAAAAAGVPPTAAPTTSCPGVPSTACADK